MSDQPASSEPDPDEDEPVRGTPTVLDRSKPEDGKDDLHDLFADEERSPRRMILAVMIPEDGPALVAALGVPEDRFTDAQRLAGIEA